VGKLVRLGFAYYYSALACIIYLLISSTAESSFVQPYAVLFFYIIGAYVSQLDHPLLSSGPGKAEKNCDSAIAGPAEKPAELVVSP
jgi:hypothetical protein